MYWPGLGSREGQKGKLNEYDFNCFMHRDVLCMYMAKP